MKRFKKEPLVQATTVERALIAVLVVGCALLASSVAMAQPVSFLAIPSSGFTPQTSEGTGNAGYGGNASGTERLFEGSHSMFAPVHLPHRATVVSMRCGGRAPVSNRRVIFTLRRNEPQQANVDMATAMTTFEGNGFQFVDASSITSPVVDNARFNYYIFAQTDDTDDVGFGSCPSCTVGFCRVGYTFEGTVAAQ